jgi:hypothetical protein
MRAYLSEHDQAVDRVVVSDRDALVLGIYAREPLGGERVFAAEVEKTGHEMAEPPASAGDAGTYLLWTPTMSRSKPTPNQGWQLVLQRRELRLYAPS